MFLVFALASLAGWAAAPPEQNAAPVPSRIVETIDEGRLVTLKHTVHPLANARNDRGAAPDGMKLDRMHLVLSRSASQESALRELIGDMHTPGTASYHKWLTPDQFGKQFGPSDQDLATVQAWLGQHGFSVTQVNPGRQTIEFSGNVGQLRTAFHTQIHKYAVNGESHYANATDPKIPAALAPVVGGFVALNNFHAKSYVKALGKASYNPKTDKATPEWTVGDPTNGYSFVLSPGDYAVQYDLNPLYKAGTNGTGQTIAIINESNINIGLVNSFRTLFGLPANPPQVIIDGNDPGIDGINNPDGPNDASVEAYLDVEWAGAVAPNATVDLVIGGDTALESGLFLAAERAVYSNLAPIMSLSFGNCEAALGTTNAFLNSLWEQAAAQGITVLVSTGDNGSAGCDDDNTQYYAIDGLAVSGFASTPFNVAVGGTDFYYSAYNQGNSAIDAQIATYWNVTASNNTPAVSILGVIPEQPWNSSQYGFNLLDIYTESGETQTSIAGGSGGASAIYTTKPTWQTGKGVPGDGVRDIPDVSLFASSGANASYYPICATDGDCQPVASSGTVQIFGVGGTSASTPSFAAMMALVNQVYGRQGQADYVLYPLATQFPASFHDVTVGTNTVPCDFSDATPDCISVSNPAQVTDPNLGAATEGELGTGTTADYNATVGYDLASGLGTIDANQLVTNWGSVKLASTTTTLSPSQSTFTHGTPIIVNGTVTGASGTPSGDVALLTSSTDPNQQGGAGNFFTLTNGAYTGSVANLPGGTYNIWGHYGGSSTEAGSSSTPVQVTVTPESSTLNFNIYTVVGTINSSNNPGSVTYGMQLDLSAQPVSSAAKAGDGVPTGTVAFKDGSTTINTAVVNTEGDAEYNPPLAIGAHSLSATYSGDQSYGTSSASAIAFSVVKDTPEILVNASNNIGQGYIGGTNQPTILTVQVENGTIAGSAGNQIFPVKVSPPTGTITVSGLPSGVPSSATLVAGVDPTTGAPEGIASFSIPASTSSSNYTVTVNYPGDGNYATNSTQTQVQVFQPSGGLTSTTAATVSGSTISPTTTIVVNGTVTGKSGQAAPTGGVLVYSSGNFITEAGFSSTSGDVSSFSVVLNSQTLSQGANFLTLQYTGDNTYYPSAVALPNPNPIQNPLSDFSMVPQSTIVAVAAPGGSGSVPINLTSINGFAGAVALTVTADPSITVTFPASVTLAANGTQTLNLSLTSGASVASGTYNVRITGVDSTKKFVHTLGLQLVVGGNAAAVPGFALSNSGAISIAQGATTGNTSTVSVTPSNGFTGSVTLACAVTTSPTGATSPVTCSIPSTASVSGTAAATATLTVASTSTTTAGAYAITVSGTSGTITSSTTVNVTVTAAAAQSFTLKNSGNITVAPGATTGNTSTITVAAVNGFTGAVSLSCSVSPAAASDPATCSLASSSVSGSGTDVLTVSTTAATSALNRPADKPAKFFWPSAGGTALALVCLLGIPARRRRNWMAMLALVVFFASIAAIGCGGSSKGGGGGNTGTTPGTYTVTVTGVSGTITQTTPVTLTVQ